MCRVLAYLGDPISLEHVLFETDSSLVRQSYSPRMMAAFLNLAGFGMVAWDPRSVHADDPFTYRVTTLPAFDRNLHALAAKLAPTCLVAHVRGITYSAPRDDRGGEPAPVPLPRRERRAGAQRPPARVRAHALRPHQPRPARARAADRGDDGLRVDLRARALAARGSLRRAGAGRAGRRRRVHAADPPRGARPPRDRHVVAGEPLPDHGPRAHRHAVLVRLRLVPRRGRAARDRPAVREPLVHASAASTSSATGSRR